MSRVFKGATRPPLVLGVPLVSIVLLALLTLLPMVWLMIAKMLGACVVLLIVFFTGYFWMRISTKKDPWRTKQAWQRARMRWDKGNLSIWHSISYAPYELKKRRKSFL
jgi:type IV secretion system protein VirB3